MVQKKYLLLSLIFFYSIGWTMAQENKSEDPDFQSFDVKEILKNEKLNSVVDAGWVPYFKGQNMLGGIYKLPKGTVDKQQPHKTDEIYYVLEGKAKIEVEEEVSEVYPGQVLFVKAKASHRFFEIKEDLVLLVFFDQ